jgi:hypothetical protein
VRPPIALSLVALASALYACRGAEETARPLEAGTPARPAYVVSEAGGTAPTGPGERWNRCERIWCLEHGENYFITHFLDGHRGWILHTEELGDVFSPQGGPHRRGFPEAGRTALRLCGAHLHPWSLARGSGAVRHTGFNANLGYGRGHWGTFGTRLEPCCPNGLGWAWLHTRTPRQFRFHDTEDYRANPERGWAKPFQVAAR